MKSKKPATIIHGQFAAYGAKTYGCEAIGEYEVAGKIRKNEVRFRGGDLAELQEMCFGASRISARPAIVPRKFWTNLVYES